MKPTGILQCFDTVGLVIWPVKIVPEMTYYVSSGTLNPRHSLTHSLTNIKHAFQNTQNDCHHHAVLPSVAF